MARTILVIDDVPEETRPLLHFLEKENYSVWFVQSGTEAIHLMETRRPDLIICDLEMPGIGGYQVMEATATWLGIGDIPFLLANEEWTTENWSRQAGGRTADCHIPKPYVLQEVAAFVRRIFRSMDEPDEDEK